MVSEEPQPKGIRWSDGWGRSRGPVPAPHYIVYVSPVRRNEPRNMFSGGDAQWSNLELLARIASIVGQKSLAQN